jgi:hypothetical protein
MKPDSACRLDVSLSRAVRTIARAACLWVCGCIAPFPTATAGDGSVTDIGSRRELFVDEQLIERLTGGAQLRLHEPRPEPETFVTDAPWEGSGSGYFNLFQDGDRYRMYYKGVQIDPFSEYDKKRDKSYLAAVPLCYAESDDGIHWRRPNLGLNEFRGSKDNNIVILNGMIPGVDLDAGAAAVFKDGNPAATADARYKAIVHSRSPKRGLLVLKSPDGVRWSLLHPEVVITEGAFDSQNLAFWDPTIGKYRAYWRYFSRDPREATLELNSGGGPARAATAAAPRYGLVDGGAAHLGVREIRTATSKDLIHWEDMANLRYGDAPEEHLYTNQVHPYHRAPHILMGFPTRYAEPELAEGVLDDARRPAGPERTRQWSPSMRALPELEHREMRASASERYGSALTDTVLMTSRDGVNFRRWREAFLRPGIERPGSWNYGQLYMAWHGIETRSRLPGAPNELSLYAGEDYWTGNSMVLRRYTLRLDGFVSASAPLAGGEVVTKPIRFSGSQLRLNFATSIAGRVRVEIQEPDGRAIPGFSLAESDAMFGDTLDRAVTWRRSADVSRLAGRAVRLRFVLKDADVYAFQFTR